MKLIHLILLTSSISCIFGQVAEKNQGSTNMEEINDSELKPADDDIITLIPCGKFKSVRDDSDVTEKCFKESNCKRPYPHCHHVLVWSWNHLGDYHSCICKDEIQKEDTIPKGGGVHDGDRKLRGGIEQRAIAEENDDCPLVVLKAPLTEKDLVGFDPEHAAMLIELHG